MFKAQKWLVSEAMFRFDFPDHHDIFNANAKVAILVIAWLVGEYISRSKRYLSVLNTSSNADWAFVNVQVRTDTMSCTMSIIKSGFLHPRLVLSG